MIKVTMDFETRSDVDLKKCGAYEYSMGEETIATCLSFKHPNDRIPTLLNFKTMQKSFLTYPIEFRELWISWVNDPEVVFCAHNAFFEQCIYNNVLVRRFGWPKIPPTKWRCTAAKAASVAIPRNLAGAGAVMNLSIQKDFEGHRVMLKLCKPRASWKQWKEANDKIKSGKRVNDKTRKLAEKEEPDKYWTPETAPEDYKVLYHYCKLDVLTEEKLDETLPDLTPKEQYVWFLDQHINFRGVQVDIPLVKRISKIMEDEAKVMNRELDVLTMGLVGSANARAAILDFLTLENIEMPDLRAKTVDEFLENGKVTGDAEKILKIRRSLSKASTAKYQTFLRRAATDGRVRDIVMYHGSSTGRWAGVGIQPQNFPRGILEDIYDAIENIKTLEVEDLKMLYGENLMPVFSSVLRGMFIATPGHDMLVEDYSAIECRVTWWLANHEKGLQMFRDGKDPYVEMAAHIFKKSILEITKEERQVGKAAVLGCGYQMGNKKFVTSAWDVYRAKVTSDMAKVAVSKYREVHSPVTELWEGYENACINATENPKQKYRVGRVEFLFEKSFLWITLPSGRKIAYKDPQVVSEPVYKYFYKDEEQYTGSKTILDLALKNGAKYLSQFQAKKLKYMAVNMKAKKEECVIPKWTRESTYGGKITENIVQAVSRDILAEAMVRVHKLGVKTLMHSHDEMVSEAPIGKFKLEKDSKGNLYAPEFRKIMEELPKWADGLPLQAGGWAGDRYRKG